MGIDSVERFADELPQLLDGEGGERILQAFSPFCLYGGTAVSFEVSHVVTVPQRIERLQEPRPSSVVARVGCSMSGFPAYLMRKRGSFENTRPVRAPKRGGENAESNAGVNSVRRARTHERWQAERIDACSQPIKALIASRLPAANRLSECYVESMLSFAKCPSIAALCRAGEHLSEELRAAVMADGERVVPALLQVLTDEELAYESAPDGGWAPIHAVDLLVTLCAHEAIEPMLELLRNAEFDDIVHSRIVVRLPELGGAVLEPALAHVDRTTDQDVLHALACVVAALGIRDERIYGLLCRLFKDDPNRTACCLAQYGDLRGLELLHGAIVNFETDSSSVGNRCDFQCLVEQYKALGTSLPVELAQHVAERERQWEIARRRTPDRAQTPFVRSTGVKLGRNDLCLCGSGKKYKKCCLGKAQM